jgi:hypothetical protein
MKKSKKAQVQTTETIAVLFIFFVLILFGLIFYFKYTAIAFKDQQRELLGARSIDTTSKVLFLPELICSRGEAQALDNCIDVMKLNRANETLQAYLNDYYYDLLGYSTVTVTEIFPKSRNWILYDKPRPPQDGVEPDQEASFFIVSLRDRIPQMEGQMQFSYGYVKVVVYG